MLYSARRHVVLCMVSKSSKLGAIINMKSKGCCRGASGKVAVVSPLDKQVPMNQMITPRCGGASDTGRNNRYQPREFVFLVPPVPRAYTDAGRAGRVGS
jgi:hypothetical protein